MPGPGKAGLGTLVVNMDESTRLDETKAMIHFPRLYLFLIVSYVACGYTYPKNEKKSFRIDFHLAKMFFYYSILHGWNSNEPKHENNHHIFFNLTSTFSIHPTV